MNVRGWLSAHQRSLLLASLVLVVSGVFSAVSMPVSLFPNVAFPRIQVFLDAGDRPAQQMVLEITKPAEEAVRSVRGVVGVRSTTSRGSAEIAVDFRWGTDMRRALLEVNAAVSQILSKLPAGTQLDTRRADPTVFPILAYSLRSKTASLTKLRDLAQYQLMPLLTSIPGVAKATVQGGKVAEYHIDVNPLKLRALGLSITDVAQAVSKSASIAGLGRLEDHYKLYLVLADQHPDSVAAIRHIIVRAGSGGVVTVGDIATVKLSSAPRYVRVTADGQDAVLLNVYQQPDGNSVQIAKDVASKLREFESHMPKGVVVANWYDQTQLVKAAAGSVRDAILIGIALAGLVLLAFLRNSRLILIAMIDVPAVIAVTVLVLYITGQSFNMMTLGGMAAAVGLIIDDVIVMLEHIVRRLGEREGDIPARVSLAAAEFAMPLTGSSAATIVIFLPLAFLSGVTGAFFKALSLTMATGLLVSFFWAWAIVPLLAARLISKRHAHETPPGPIARRLQHFYARLLGGVLRRPAVILMGIVPLLVAGAFAYTRVGSGFMPFMDEGGFILDYRAAPGTSLTETDRLLRQVEAIIQANPNVQTYSRRTGTQLGGGITESYEGDFFIRLKSGSREPIETVMTEIRTAVEKKVPGLDIELAQLMEDLIGDLVAVPQPVEIKLFSDNQSLLEKTAHQVAGVIKNVPGVVGVRDGINPAGDALDVQVDPAKAALEGVDPAAVTRQVGEATAGVVATKIPQSPKMVGIRVWIPPVERNEIEKLEALSIRAPDGHVFPLSRVATLQRVSGQPQITREDLKRMVAVTARISGRSLGGTVADIKRALKNAQVIPPQMYTQYGGLYAQQQQAFRGLVMVMGAAIALVFVLLLLLYERFRVAISIMLMPLVAMSAVFIGLWVTGIELNISSMMGMTMIVGIVTEIAIFFFSEFSETSAEAPMGQRLRDTGHHRMRPILMSATAAILTLLPLALGIGGAGAQMQQPLAISIISGLIVAVPLVLLAMPGLFLLTHPRRTRDAAR